ncbi:hypothetical protein VFPPC_18167 [Pochonia chlamydosporia 170]|uniref:Uncharacterized protein n=1 Tax=Pochonia chlamydosporia 170 TaxID=1380566 RepID=A0A219AS90_METCM|nr:hypothetical protein VFPPC_18167 [Pochonia chlamydosporia 170]OWT43630.1 hypothetical protein VFPPC_18167 [Pochonia chlamydosporia 170]
MVYTYFVVKFSPGSFRKSPNELKLRSIFEQRISSHPIASSPVVPASSPPYRLDIYRCRVETRHQGQLESDSIWCFLSPCTTHTLISTYRIVVFDV